MIAAALRYFALIFTLGFVLGAIRTLLLAPRIGPTPAVLMELPVMLAASWLVATRIVQRERFSPPKALAMGVLAFALLMAAEALIAVFLAGQSLAAWSSDLLRTPGWVGLAGQIGFGMFPLLAALRLKAPDIRA